MKMRKEYGDILKWDFGLPESNSCTPADVKKVIFLRLLPQVSLAQIV